LTKKIEKGEKLRREKIEELKKQYKKIDPCE